MQGSRLERPDQLLPHLLARAPRPRLQELGGGGASTRRCHGDRREGRGLRGKEVSALALEAAPAPLHLPAEDRAWAPAARAPRPGRRARGHAPPPRTDSCAVPCARQSRGRARPAGAFRMLIKEYHILLPMSLDEYQVAQLYMIQVRVKGGAPGGTSWGAWPNPNHSCCGAWGGLGAPRRQSPCWMGGKG